MNRQTDLLLGIFIIILTITIGYLKFIADKVSDIEAFLSNANTIEIHEEAK